MENKRSRNDGNAWNHSYVSSDCSVIRHTMPQLPMINQPHKCMDIDPSHLKNTLKSMGLRRFGSAKLQCSLGTGSHMELVIDMPQMPAYGAICQAQPVGNGLVGETASQQFQDF
jgi:hypothetical protein